MTVAAVTTTAWSAGVALTADTPVQNIGHGVLLLAWDNGTAAPASETDGMRLRPGEAIIVPSGNTIYYSKLNATDTSVFYESFT